MNSTLFRSIFFFFLLPLNFVFSQDTLLKSSRGFLQHVNGKEIEIGNTCFIIRNQIYFNGSEKVEGQLRTIYSTPLDSLSTYYFDKKIPKYRFNHPSHTLSFLKLNRRVCYGITVIGLGLIILPATSGTTPTKDVLITSGIGSIITAGGIYLSAKAIQKTTNFYLHEVAIPYPWNN